MPAATVTVTNPATGIRQTQQTGADGTYQMQALPPGAYEVAVEAKGFSRAVVRNLVLTVGQTVAYDIHLTLGPFSVVVAVTDRPSLIETEQTQQANTVDNLQVVNLPNISRNFTQAIYTVPGVVNSQAPSIQDPNIGTGYLASGFSIGGSNGRNNLFTIDGGEDDFGSGALRVQHVPLESIQEYQVNRNSLEAEFGFTTGTSINIVTRTGTNRLHGSAYGYFHDEATDATNFFNRFSPNPASRPFEQSLIAGGTLGGPIEKDRLFFFTSYEHQKLDSAVEVNLLGTAEALGLGAEANGFNPATGQCPGQTSSPQQVTQLCYLTQMAALGGPLAPVGSGLIASPVFSPLQDPIFRALLAPDSGTFDGNAGGYVQAPPNQNGRYNNWVTRLDYVPNIKDSFTLRFSLMHEVNRVTGAGGAPALHFNHQSGARLHRDRCLDALVRVGCGRVRCACKWSPTTARMPLRPTRIAPRSTSEAWARSEPSLPTLIWGGRIGFSLTETFPGSGAPTILSSERRIGLSTTTCTSRCGLEASTILPMERFRSSTCSPPIPRSKRDLPPTTPPWDIRRPVRRRPI